MPKKPISLLSTLLIFFLLNSFSCFSQFTALDEQLKAIASNAIGKVSIAATLIEDSISYSFYGDERCIMQSVFKFPIALAILNRVDKGEFSLQHKMHISPKEMEFKTWSPLRDSLPNGNVNISFADLIYYSVALSDNVACDVLLRYFKKPKEVEKYIKSFDIEDFAIKYNERKMQKNYKNQYKNYSSPKAMIAILCKFFDKKILSETNTNFLYDVMLNTETGVNRIKKLLPAGTKVAHKTGTSGTNEQGLTYAVNDVGILTLSNGKHLALAIFVNESYASVENMEATIALSAKAIYDFFEKGN